MKEISVEDDHSHTVKDQEEDQSPPPQDQGASERQQRQTPGSAQRKAPKTADNSDLRENKGANHCQEELEKLRNIMMDMKKEGSRMLIKLQQMEARLETVKRRICQLEEQAILAPCPAIRGPCYPSSEHLYARHQCPLVDECTGSVILSYANERNCYNGSDSGDNQWDPHSKSANSIRGDQESTMATGGSSGGGKRDLPKEDDTNGVGDHPITNEVNTSEEGEPDHSCSVTHLSGTYMVKVESFVSFRTFRAIPGAEYLDMTQLPTPPSVGDGLGYLYGHPLPLEVWLSSPKGNTPTVMGCGDTGGQCLIRYDVLKSRASGVQIKQNSQCKPYFRGIGGGISYSLGFAVVPVYIPDEEALGGNIPFGKVVKLDIEFQVVQDLNCNFLIGRDAIKAYGIDFIESEGIARIGGFQFPIADWFSHNARMTIHNVVTLAMDMVIPPHSDVVIPVIISARFPETQTLLFAPRGFVNVSKQLHGRIPSALIHRHTPFLTFSNMCNSPIKLKKDEYVGTVRQV